MLTEEQAEKIREQLLAQLSRLPEEQVGTLKEKITHMSPDELEKFIQQQRQQSGQQPAQPTGEQAQQAQQPEQANAQAPQTGEPAQQSQKCLFCEIASGNIETTKVYEDDEVLAILDISPAALGHTIVMPKQHHQFLFQLPETLLLKLLKITGLLEEIVVNATESHGINIQIAQGVGANQAVPHLAIHIIPRKKEDGLNFEWERKQVEKSELEKIAEKIKEKVQKDFSEKEEEKAKTEEEQQEEKTEAEQMMKHFKERIP